MKQCDFDTSRNLTEGATTIVLWEKSPKKEGAYPKMEIDTDRLSKSDIDYKVY